MRRTALALTAGLLVAAAPAAAHAGTYAPPKGKVLTGLTGTESSASFAAETGQRPSVLGFFTKFFGSWEYIWRAAEREGATPMLHIGTNRGYGTREDITPLGIARGEGDRYLVRLNRRMREYGKPVHIRLMAEMNQANNAYSAFDRDGRFRGRAHSPQSFKQAWRRTTLILRGGALARIDARLARLGLPPVQGASKDLPTPQMAMHWVPQTEGSPPIPANSARAYWPGAGYVDWVGTDFYSKFPNFGGLETFYRDPLYAGKPFVFGEWAIWDGDHAAWVRRFFRWVESHPRVRMIVYNQGRQHGGPFRLTHRPGSRRAVARAFRDPRYD